MFKKMLMKAAGIFCIPMYKHKHSNILHCIKVFKCMIACGYFFPPSSPFLFLFVHRNYWQMKLDQVQVSCTVSIIKTDGPKDHVTK